MPRIAARPFAALLTALVSASALAPSARSQGVPLAGVAEVLGRRGAEQPGGVMRFSFPRSDLTVVADSVTLAPAFALGSWVAFQPVGNGAAMAMGDLVLTEDEVGPVMRALQAGGVEQSALHNHVLHESPRVMYMHIAAHGDPAKIAQAIRAALAQSRTPMGTPAPPAAASAADLDTTAIAAALGVHGKLNGVVYQVSVPRRERITENGHEIPPSMGVATALHSHMLDESPRLFFMHFWARADATALAKGLRTALDQTASKLASK